MLVGFGLVVSSSFPPFAHYHGYLPFFLFWCEITARVDEGSLLTEKAKARPKCLRMCWSHQDPLCETEPACRGLTCPWPSASNRNPFLPLLFVKPDGLMKAILMCHFFITCSRAKAFPPFFWQNAVAWYSRVKSCSLPPAPFYFFTSYSGTRLAKKSNFTLSVPERINTVKLHWISTATFFSWLYFRPITWG